MIPNFSEILTKPLGKSVWQKYFTGRVQIGECQDCNRKTAASPCNWKTSAAGSCGRSPFGSVSKLVNFSIALRADKSLIITLSLLGRTSSTPQSIDRLVLTSLKIRNVQAQFWEAITCYCVVMLCGVGHIVFSFPRKTISIKPNSRCKIFK